MMSFKRLFVDRSLKITSIGDSIMSAMPHLVGTQLDDVFELERPIIDFTWNSVSLKIAVLIVC